MISVKDDVKVPVLEDVSVKTRNQLILVKTLAVALAPGDCRVLSGKTRELQGPPSFPYIPGGDGCGIVMAINPQQQQHQQDEKELLCSNTTTTTTKKKKKTKTKTKTTTTPSSSLPFQVGDRVAVRFVGKPLGMLGEYSLVSTAVCDKVPDTISSVEAAALASACPAVLIADRVRKGERVLVLGAGGGIGSHVCQLVRSHSGASYVVGVSKDPERLVQEPICCDKAYDYTKDDVFSLEEFKKQPFDVIIDLASGGWLQLLTNDTACPIVKSASQGGRYLTTTPDTATFEIHSMWDLVNIFVFPSLWRAFTSRLWNRYRLPAYTFAMSLPDDRNVMTRTMDLAASGKVKAVIDPKGPYPFTTEGVRGAFHLQQSRHAQGKVVVQVTK